MKSVLNVIICILVFCALGPQLAISGPPTEVVSCVESGESLQSALSTAMANGKTDLIKVAQGTYFGNFSYNSIEDDYLILKGGYTPGTNCATQILDPTNTVLDGGESGRVLFLRNKGDITVEGFTIQNGTIDDHGAGLYAESYSTSGSGKNIWIQYNIITENTSTGISQMGGGIYAVSSGETGSGIISITGNIITYNSSEHKGGGISVNTSTTTGAMDAITITQNTCSNNNSGDRGGGMHITSTSSDGVSSSNITLQENTITGNTVSGSDEGGGIFVLTSGETGSGDITFRENTITDNTSVGDGGGVYATASCSAETGGSITLIGNNISGNTAFNYSGLYSKSDGEVVLVNNMINGNTSSDTYGGAFIGAYGLITLTNNTIAMNTSSTRGGVSFFSYPNNDIYAYNNIVWGNTGDDIYIQSGTGYGYNNNYSGYVLWTGESQNNIDKDPKFVSTTDFHLKPTSPCINAGLNSAPEIRSKDYDGDPRIQNNTVDMGADETLKAAVTSQFYLLLFN